MINTTYWIKAALALVATCACPPLLHAAEATPGGWDSLTKSKQVLYYTKCSGFEHSVVKRSNATELSYSEKILTDLGARHHFKVVCTKDGTIFTPASLAPFDAIIFYTSGMLTELGTDKNPPMTAEGKTAFLQAIKQGKGFVGLHAANDSFHVQPDPADKSARFVSYGDKVDPYIAMLGGEFIRHGPQQVARNLVIDNHFPGCEGLKDSFSLMEEWYTFKDFAKDMHVILVQETKGMKGVDYQRANFPATWARQEGKGRVFYTSLGHREDVWTNPLFQNLLLGGLGWACGNVDARVDQNLTIAAPGHAEIQPKDAPKPAIPAKKK